MSDYTELKQSALREADQRDLTDNPHVGGGEPDRWDDDGTSDKLRALVAALDAKDEALQAVHAAMLNGGDGDVGDYGWNITKLNRARPLIRAALGVQQ